MPPPMPSIAEVADLSTVTTQGANHQPPQSTINDLPRLEAYPSRPITAQDMQLVTPPANPAPSSNINAASSNPRMSFKEFAKSWLIKPELKTRVAILLVWSVVFIVVLSIYLGLFMGNKLTAPPLQIALILITLMAAFFFFHSLIRVCLAVARPFSYPDEEQPQAAYVNPMFGGMTAGPGPWGYAQPERPIQVYAMPGQGGAPMDDNGAPKELPPPPPAYGTWRQTVRVNPAQFYWVRRSQAEGVYSQGNNEPPSNRTSIGSTGTRPPSYASGHVSQQGFSMSMRLSRPLTDQPVLIPQLTVTSPIQLSYSPVSPDVQLSQPEDNPRSTATPLTARLPLR
ncbi:hypothetical protein TWF106_002797 [Orbilia oligospora]|uniref:Uncharacterized protein n=1 Tax=Orbilia oligospora TaxID=2813651 RepID=A0A7C8PAD3_ORBOL|nr:hypothetical protein TWF788_001112 [Orbilia oligospora]KAF3201512.1 hypothetical protein TWF106_002797 [Orbilia oligospora]KAF3205297.1 hypothetical protein TWF191_001914 [Orbilia oligospora]